MFALSLFACSGGGGCSGCAGCGIEPIPGGYPLDRRIDNAAQFRLNSSGIAFLEDNIDSVVATLLPGGLDFTVDEQNISAGIDITVCRGGGCVAHIEVDSVDLVPSDPNLLVANLRLILDSRNSAGERDNWPGTCNLDIDTRRGDRPYVGVIATIRAQGVDAARPARGGYTEIVVESIELSDGEDIENSDINISGGFLGSCGLLNLGFLKGFIIGLVQDQISGLADTAIGDQLCTTQGEFGCPDGTTPDGDPGDPTAVCRYGDGVCASILLGLDGQGDLGGQLIGGFSPGTHAYAQFLLASGGNAEAVNEGLSLFMFGGFEGTNRDFSMSPGHNACVPVIDRPPLPTIPRVGAFRNNVIPGTTEETHISVGIAESFLDYAGYGLFDSGALCIGAGTRLSQMLSTGLLSAAIMSVPDLTYPLDNAPITIALRPQQPPDFTLGTGDAPTLTATLPELEMDFYVWSTERYIRFMTFRSDLVVGVNLTAEAGELVPTIVSVDSNEATVSNSELLGEDPAVLATTISTVLRAFAGMLGSAIGPIALPEIMGFEPVIPADGIRAVNDGGENFLGIFANLQLASTSMSLIRPADTSLEVSDIQLDRESMHPAHWGEGEGNRLWLHFEGHGIEAVDYEYSYRIDDGPWSLWTTDPRIRVDDDVLLLQARHEIEARARVLGEPETVDETPARVEVVIDILPPRVRLSQTDERFEVSASDLITPDTELEYRYRVNGAWTDWTHDATHPLIDQGLSLEVEVRDESDNIGRASAGLIRGLPNPMGGDGCGCRTAGDERGLPFGLLALLGVLGAVFMRRRRRRWGRGLAAALGLSMVVLFASGCECGSSPTDPPDGLACGGRCVEATPPTNTSGSLCCESTDMCAMYDVDALCMPGFTCPLDNLVLDEGTCGVTCSECMAKPPVRPGVMATHLDMVLDEAGTAYVSGYNPGNPNGLDLGDLVFGAWNGTDVDWEVVDGAPDSPITNDPNGWRGGVSAPGDDVGRWTSMVESTGTFMIAHYDGTNTALRFSAGGPGTWSAHTIDELGDAGRYASLLLLDDGTPAVAYLRMAENEMTPGEVRGQVMVAIATSTAPAAPTDWTITEVASAVMPCRPGICEGLGAVCLENGNCATPSSDCGDCGGNTCVAGSCEAALGAGYVEDLPPAYGLYTSMARTSTGLAVVWYDRTSGNIFGAAYDGTAWGAPFHIDGYLLGDPFVGDSGQGADLAVDSADVWHVVYIDGAEETLRYSQVQSDGTVLTREVIDDGSTSDGTTRFMDGRHIIGDDASIVVDEGGGVRVVYQDATAGHAVAATRPAGGGPWAIARIDTEGSTGYWLSHALLGTTSYVATFWRTRPNPRSGLESGVRVTTLE